MAVVCAAGLMAGPALAGTTSAIGSNFNGTPIAGGRTIWFNSVFSAHPTVSSDVTIFVTNSTISLTNNGTTYVILVPDATITLHPSLPLATATFGAPSDWAVQAEPASGNSFLTGVSFGVPKGGLTGGSNPVTWTADFASDTPGISLSWKWAAAVYTAFDSDLDAVGVKPIDANSGSAYLNSDHAGTPEMYKQYVIGGARGGGGSNFTGSYSGTASLPLPPIPAPGTIGLLVGALPLAFRRRRRA